MASYAIQGKVLHVRQRLLRIPMVEVGIAVIAEAELRFGVGAQTGTFATRNGGGEIPAAGRDSAMGFGSREILHHSATLSNGPATRWEISGHDDRGSSPVRTGDAGQA